MQIVPQFTPSSPLTIVQRDDAFPDYPFERLNHHLLAEIRAGYATLPLSLRGIETVQPRHLECVLQICGIHLPNAGFASAEFWRGCVAYVGAVNSQKFIDATHAWRHRQTTAFARLLRELQGRGFLVPPLTFSSAITGVSESIRPFVDFFEDLPLDAEKVWLWQGWWSRNRDARKRQRFPFFPIYKRLGREFTERLYKACDAWATSHNAGHNPILRPLAEYIGAHDDALTVRRLQDPAFTELFWHQFFAYFVSSRHEMGNELATSLAVWNAQTIRFISGCLESCGLFAKPAQMPAAPKRTKTGALTKILKQEDGTDAKGRLITLVPVHCTDDQALQVLLKDIRREIEIVQRWAEGEYAQFCANVDARALLAKQGTVRVIQKVGANSMGHKQLVAKDNPQAMANAAATFEHYGYQTHEDTSVALLYPKPIPETALKLGVPNAGSLLPHLTLLVHDHPKITSSFLEKLQLYDKHGNMQCVQILDGVTMLVGAKDRAGPGNAQQAIVLTARGKDVVTRIIQATAPLRSYLKARGDDNWRSFLLSSGKSFGYPSPIKNISGLFIHPKNRKNLSSSLERQGLDRRSAESIADRLTLATLRASIGVRVYLDTGSVHAMSEAMGHVEFNPSLLDHYLPLQVQRIFRERWIRIFQTSLIVEAVKGTDLVLEASGLSSMQELDEFLSHHAFKRLDPLVDGPADVNDREIAFGISTGILALLFGLQHAVQNATKAVCGRAQYWALVTDRIVDYIMAPESGREDLRNLVISARSIRVQESFERFVYA